MVWLLACAGPGDPALVLTGWEYEWEQLSHRVSYVRVGIEPDSSLDLGLVGGDWSTGATFTDTPMYRVRYQEVSGSGVTILRDSVRLSVGPEPEETGTLTFDVAGIPPASSLVAVIGGFELDTGVAQGEDYPDDYNPAYGYTSNGFGIRLGEVTRDSDTATVPVTGSVRWGPQDREDMNAAIPYAVTELGVDVVLIAAPGEPEVQSVSGESAYEHDPPYSEQPAMTTSVAFAEAAEGVVGWRSFDLTANASGADAGEGEYLRAFGMELVPTGAETTGWDGEVTATLSSSSAIEFTDFQAAFSGEIVRVASPDVYAEHWLVSGSHPTGQARTGPTLP